MERQCFDCAASSKPSAADIISYRDIGTAAGATTGRSTTHRASGLVHVLGGTSAAAAAAFAPTTYATSASSPLAHLGLGYRLGGFIQYTSNGFFSTEDMEAAVTASSQAILQARLESADIIDEDQEFDEDSDLQAGIAASHESVSEEAQLQAVLAMSLSYHPLSPSSASDAPSADAAATTSPRGVIDLTAMPDGTEPIADMASKPRMATARGSKSASVTIYIDWDDDPSGVAMAIRDSGSSSSPEVIDLTGTNAAHPLKRKEPEAPTTDAERPARAHATCPSGSVSNKPYH